jgi:hypothetical protein
MKKVKLHITETEEAFPHTDRSWFFMKHEDPDESNYDLRWVVGYRKKGNWWGVIAAFPATHESAISDVAQEMALAMMAIRQLKGELLS